MVSPYGFSIRKIYGVLLWLHRDLNLDMNLPFSGVSPVLPNGAVWVTAVITTTEVGERSWSFLTLLCHGLTVSVDGWRTCRFGIVSHAFPNCWRSFVTSFVYIGILCWPLMDSMDSMDSMEILEIITCEIRFWCFFFEGRTFGFFFSFFFSFLLWIFFFF